MAFSGQLTAIAAAAVYVCLLAVIYVRRDKWPIYRFLTGRKACIISFSTVLSLLLIFGLVPQDGGGDGLWGVLGFRAMKRSPVFIAALLLLATSLSLNAIEDIHQFSRHRLGVTVSHLTLSIILLTGIFAGGTTVRAKLEAHSGLPVHTASDERDGGLRKLPFELTLSQFHIDSYASDLTVTLPDGSFYETTVAVNHPAKVGSWMIYQTDYRMSPEEGKPVSVFKCVYSPLSGVYDAVLYLILISAAAMAFFAGAGRSGDRRRYLVSILVSVVFIGICIIRPGVHTDRLLPALRSPWLVPHITAYIFAYTLMGIVTILALCILWSTRRRKTGAPAAPESSPESSSAAAALRRRPIPEEQIIPLCDRLVRIGWAFLTMGMVMGALWAKQAWGDWWAWDPKEVWAAVTWLGYLLYLHLRGNAGLDGGAGRAKRSAVVLLIVCFALLQMCWWGVNLLPAAQGFSLHTY